MGCNPEWYFSKLSNVLLRFLLFEDFNLGCLAPILTRRFVRTSTGAVGAWWSVAGLGVGADGVGFLLPSCRVVRPRDITSSGVCLKVRE